MSANIVPQACQTFLQKLGMAANKAQQVSPEGTQQLVTNMYRDGLSGKKPGPLDWITEFMINSMLSGTGTPIVNAVSAATQALAKPSLELLKAVGKSKAERRAARAMFSASFDGLGADLIFFNKAIKSGLPADFELSPKALGLNQKQFNELMVDAGAEVDAFGNVSDAQAQAAMAEAYDYMTKAIPGPIGTIIRAPSNLTVAIDEYFKARFRNQKVLYLLSKKATADEEAGKGSYDDLFTVYKDKWMKATKEDRFAYADRLESLFGNDADPFRALYDARNYATDGSFQTKLTGLPGLIEKAKRSENAATRFAANVVIPFMRTPWNLVLEGSSYVPGIGVLVRPKQTLTTATIQKLEDGTEQIVRRTAVV